MTKVDTFQRYPSNAQIKSKQNVNCASQKISLETSNLHFLKIKCFASIFSFNNDHFTLKTQNKFATFVRSLLLSLTSFFRDNKQTSKHPTKLDCVGTSTHGSMIVMTVNSRGQTEAGPNQDKIKDKCRLPHLTSLVTSGLVDIVVVPEANLNEEQARHATRFVQHSSGSRVWAHSAPTSTAVSTMENILAGSLVTRSSFGGLLVLMKSEVFNTLISTTHYQSGRVLHI